MKFLVFDFKGKFVYFRKFYINFLLFLYLVLLRIVIEGVVAVILGFERDSYYEEFLVENFLIVV